jgi:hypothetical protein
MRAARVGLMRKRQVHTFQAENSALTLAQGLAEYYAANPWLKRGLELPEPARTFFVCHDEGMSYLDATPPSLRRPS